MYTHISESALSIYVYVAVQTRLWACVLELSAQLLRLFRCLKCCLRALWRSTKDPFRVLLTRFVAAHRNVSFQIRYGLTYTTEIGTISLNLDDCSSMMGHWVVYECKILVLRLADSKWHLMLLLFVPSCIQKDMHAYMHSYIHTCMHACIHTYMHICMHPHVRTYIPTYIHTYIHGYTYIRTCVRTYVLTYKATHIHTYLHTYIPT